MRPRAPHRALLQLLLASAGITPAAAVTGDGRPGALPPARDGNVAIRQELEAARHVATLAAYDLFIARHPDHPLADIARREREALERQRRPAPDGGS